MIKLILPAWFQSINHSSFISYPELWWSKNNSTSEVLIIPIHAFYFITIKYDYIYIYDIFYYMYYIHIIFLYIKCACTVKFPWIHKHPWYNYDHNTREVSGHALLSNRSSYPTPVFPFPYVCNHNSDRMTCNLFREGLCDSRIQRGGTTRDYSSQRNHRANSKMDNRSV